MFKEHHSKFKELGEGSSVRDIKQFLFLILYYGNQKVKENGKDNH